MSTAVFVMLLCFCRKKPFDLGDNLVTVKQRFGDISANFLDDPFPSQNRILAATSTSSIFLDIGLFPGI